MNDSNKLKSEHLKSLCIFCMASRLKGRRLSRSLFSYPNIVANRLWNNILLSLTDNGIVLPLPRI